MTLDEIFNAIGGTPGAIKPLEACEFGTGGDLRIGAAVEKKCERDLLNRLKPPQKRTYRREMGVCDAPGGGPVTGPLAVAAIRPRARPWPSRRWPGTPPVR